jgi:hypothetical protein
MLQDLHSATLTQISMLAAERRFTVSCKTRHGVSAESTPTASVMPDKALPPGWLLEVDEASGTPLYR